MGRVIDRFASSVASLSHSEKHVLYYIDDHLDEAKTLPLTEMADINNVSTTTIVRMCHKLGLEGFTELKYILKTLDKDYIPSDENILNRHQHDINTMLSQLTIDDINKMTNLMMSADKVIIVAVGLSKMMGEYLSKLLMQVNKPTFYVYESHIIDLLSNMVGKNDLVVFISSSGETQTIVKIAEKLRYHQTSTAAITNTVDSQLNSLVTTAVSANVERVTFGGYDLTARSTLLVLIDIIFESYLMQKLRES
ncbi:MurR/RpiR family transcriptional regulator [Sutcliffiella sp. NC1]|uniref:MurR/RpiR family transcriptional regulator n=1 Tax=Sutcliffiella sp. NC1 TaxID=3004096 RepID=UPI0022DE88E6|nr:MurR/RpiR family transcriptional regulator [Sutcliffiella sp. NC1]WBL14766.1 MurR/RpiR family transcriptional regulator [Sutcliffiella sp. NC1]